MLSSQSSSSSIPTSVRNRLRTSGVEREVFSRVATACAVPSAQPHLHSGSLHAAMHGAFNRPQKRAPVTIGCCTRVKHGQRKARSATPLRISRVWSPRSCACVQFPRVSQAKSVSQSVSQLFHGPAPRSPLPSQSGSATHRQSFQLGMRSRVSFLADPYTKFSFRHRGHRTGVHTDASSTPLDGPWTPLQQPYSISRRAGPRIA